MHMAWAVISFREYDHIMNLAVLWMTGSTCDSGCYLVHSFSETLEIAIQKKKKHHSTIAKNFCMAAKHCFSFLVPGQACAKQSEVHLGGSGRFPDPLHSSLREHRKPKGTIWKYRWKGYPWSVQWHRRKVIWAWCILWRTWSIVDS